MSEPPKARQISAQDFLENWVDLTSEYGYHIIHQTWKTNVIPAKFQMYRDSWVNHHPTALYILWTDADNDSFVREYYPELYFTYTNLMLVIQRVDMVRLLYLHKFGGLYADLDYECSCDIFGVIMNEKSEQERIFIVSSPFLINEVTQNSLMFAMDPGHALWYRACENIREIITFIKYPESLKKDLVADTDLTQLFSNVVTKDLANLLYTEKITGPNLLDKTILKDFRLDSSIGFLSSEKFFKINKVSVARHYHSNSWVNIGSALQPLVIISFTVILLLICGSVLFGYKQKKCSTGGGKTTNRPERLKKKQK